MPGTFLPDETFHMTTAHRLTQMLYIRAINPTKREVHCVLALIHGSNLDEAFDSEAHVPNRYVQAQRMKILNTVTVVL